MFQPYTAVYTSIHERWGAILPDIQFTPSLDICDTLASLFFFSRIPLAPPRITWLRKGIHAYTVYTPRIHVRKPSYFKTFHTHSFFSFFLLCPSTSHHLVEKGYTCIHGIHTQDTREKTLLFQDFSHSQLFFIFLLCPSTS